MISVSTIVYLLSLGVCGVAGKSGPLDNYSPSSEYGFSHTAASITDVAGHANLTEPGLHMYRAKYVHVQNLILTLSKPVHGHQPSDIGTGTRWNSLPAKRTLLATKERYPGTGNNAIPADYTIDDYWDFDLPNDEDSLITTAVMLPPDSDGSELLKTKTVSGPIPEMSTAGDGAERPAYLHLKARVRDNRAAESGEIAAAAAAGTESGEKQSLSHGKQTSNTTRNDDISRDDFDDDSLLEYSPNPEDEAKYARIPNGLLMTDDNEMPELKEQLRKQRSSRPK